jgi:peptide/nickel transport system substrate-binding protein
MRELFRDLRFRRPSAMPPIAMALHRPSCAARSCEPGPAVCIPGAPEFDKDSVVYYDYDLDSAKALLADIGLEDTDGNGILNFTEGSQAGQDVVVLADR